MAILTPGKIRVAVLRGGPSSEYEVSLNTGRHILSLLQDHPRYEPIDIFISKDGEWHKSGIVHEPHRALAHTDVVWNALHGEYGEDGQVQRILENLQIPFTGSSSLASAVSMNKVLSKDIYTRHGLLTPRHEVFDENLSEDRLLYIFKNYMHPLVVKPANAGSSIGMSIVHSFNELMAAIRHALEYSRMAMVEELIRGKEATCGVVESVRGEKIYALLPVEIRKPKGVHLFDYNLKYSGEAEEICPGNFTRAEQKHVEEMARKAHEVLGLRHYSRSDFIVTRGGKVYILETNSLPGFTHESLLPKALHAVGWKPRHFVDHVLELTLRR